MNYDGRNISLTEVLQLTRKYVCSIEQQPVLPSVVCEQDDKGEDNSSPMTSRLYKEATQVRSYIDLWLHEVTMKTTGTFVCVCVCVCVCVDPLSAL